MTFRLFAVELKNFKCYYGEHSFEFPQEPGLYYLTGRNKFNNRLGANGVGKTSLIDAVCWVLYGKTSRGLRAGDIISWGQKTCSVSVSLMVGEDEIEITRSQNPNEITINNEPATQEGVIKLLRLNQEAFEATVILPQFGQSFLDLTPTQKLSMFSEVMDLDFWLEKSKLADDKAGVIYATIVTLENHIAKLEGKLENTRLDLKDMKAKDAAYQIEVDEERVRLKSIRSEAASWVKVLTAKAKKEAKVVSKVGKALDEVDAAVRECGEEFDKAEKQVAELKADLRNTDRRIHELNVEMKELSSLQGEVCSVCKQKIGEGHVDTHNARLVKKRDKLIEESIAFVSKVEKAEKHRNQLRLDTNELVKLLREARTEFDNAREAAKQAERSLEKAKEQVARAEADLDKLAKQKNPYEDIISTRRKAIKSLKGEIKDNVAEMARQKAKHEALSFWVNGFKRVRLFVIEDALTALELEINNLLVELGLVDWKITLDVERENKSGGITKGFTVLIHSPKHDKPVRFESFSGGETQRLRLAGDLGLANLIMEQAGFVNHIEIIDEPSEHMSPEGIEDMIETLHHRAHNTGKTIWLVDHNTMDYGNFSGVIVSEMDNKGQARLVL